MNLETDISTGARTRDRLTSTLDDKLAHPANSPDFDLRRAVDEVLADVDMTAAEGGGKLSFYGQDPILPSRCHFGAMAAITLAAKSVAVAALWKHRTGEGQDISVDVRKALRRFCGFFEGKWETINGRGPSAWGFSGTPFLKVPMFRETRDGRHVLALDFYPKLRARTLSLLRCGESPEAIENAILQWRADDLEIAAAEQGLVPHEPPEAPPPAILADMDPEQGRLYYENEHQRKIEEHYTEVVDEAWRRRTTQCLSTISGSWPVRLGLRFPRSTAVASLA
jgi:hypothetical protein